MVHAHIPAATTAPLPSSGIPRGGCALSSSGDPAVPRKPAPPPVDQGQSWQQKEPELGEGRSTQEPPVEKEWGAQNHQCQSSPRLRRLWLNALVLLPLQMQSRYLELTCCTHPLLHLPPSIWPKYANLDIEIVFSVKQGPAFTLESGMCPDDAPLFF